MGMKKDYINECVDIVMKMKPDLDKDQIEKVVARILKEKLADPSIIMDNSITGDNARITLSELCNWIDKRNPVVSGNATFYMQPEELESPTSYMLRSLKKGRKAVKKSMFAMKPGSDEYQMADLDQSNKKVIMNSDYGGSGAPTAAFYTKEAPPATTLMAQSIITTMAAFFEGFIGNNQLFFNINELYDWIHAVISKKTEKVPKWVVVPTSNDVLKRLISKFQMFNIEDYDVLKMYINGMTDDELCYLYYANNLNEFISRHPKVYQLIANVLDTLPILEAAEKVVPEQFVDQFKNEDDPVLSYNKWMSKEMFLDPYSVPECIKSYMDELRSILTQFIFVEYITPDSIQKLNNHQRNTVLLVDTDSNIINADLFVSHVLNNIFPGQTFNRPRLYNEMILVNVLASIIDGCVANMLDYYGRTHNMGKEARAELTMKNEFMFRRLFLMTKKKRYAASIVLREGNIMIPFKLEIKGMDFIKAGVTEDVMKRFTKMLETHILFSDTLELHELMKELKAFEREIYHDLKQGGTKYLKPQMFKAEDAYKKITDASGRVVGSKAWSLPVFRGSMVWNELYPNNKIYSLDRVKVLKLISMKEEDLEVIRSKYPKEYQDVISKIYHSDKEDIRKAGLRVIAMPNSVKTIPEWLIPLIDYDIIVSDVISSFRSVLDALKLEEMNYKTPNGTANMTSCMISL